MMSSDDEAIDDSRHFKLLSSVAALDGKKRNIPQRCETSLSASEFNSSVSKDKVQLEDLLGAFKTSTKHGSLKKKLKRIEKKKTLSVPLPRHEKEQIQRSVAYSEVKKEISKWDSVVKENRNKEQQQFPLNQPSLKLQNSAEIIRRFKPSTDLEKEVKQMLTGEDGQTSIEKILSAAEEQALKAMSADEARERRAELQKFRALLSYKEAKARRQKKIKSKSYHRIQRKERLKKQKQEGEAQGSDAEESQVDLALRIRAEERMTLKHRGGSKFAKKQAIFAKYDKKGREAVQEMLQQSRQLTKKPVVDVSDEEEVEQPKAMPVDVTSSVKPVLYNPWTPSEGASSKSKPTNPWMEEKAAKADIYVKPDAIVNEDKDHEIESDPEEDQTENGFAGEPLKSLEVEVFDHSGDHLLQSLSRKRTLAEVEDINKDVDDVEHDFEPQQESETEAELKKKKSKKRKKEDKILDPQVTLTSSLPTHKDTQIIQDDEETDDEQRLTIAEAFANDDVIAEFKRTKQAVVDRDKPKDIDLTLPGWGEWGGTGLAVSKKKKRKFIIKAKKMPPRKDKDLSHVILSERRNESSKLHQVSNVPFPYKSVERFEEAMNTPIGRAWNPESVFKKNIAPKVVTRLGAIIRPIDKAETFRNRSMKVVHGKGAANDDVASKIPTSKRTLRRKGLHQVGKRLK